MTIIAIVVLGVAVFGAPLLVDRKPVCRTPLRKLSVAEAHEIMQDHCEHSCDLKTAAYWCLVEAGHIVPTAQQIERRMR